MRDAAARCRRDDASAEPPRRRDFVDGVYGSFPLMLVLISVVTFVLLARAFRSLRAAARRRSR